ncbi:hypothetical protein [Sphingobacterium deserti]|uniref:DUF4157 domain-containing protein n=1 Tax=Sphingobacterium deserti TaxID=1229276 RepID=A0A0B8T2Q4_9SPHI|nr:hypothetical protein [Sphingobacterium deserti]KGE15256.1 hypothetical protein DI53_0937 [Sphingobacterium deserti]
MKGIVIVSRFWTNVFSAGRATGVTIFPFIFLRSRGLKADRILLQHERIHLQQALELAVLPFYVWYLVEFLVWFVQHGNFQQAYRSISFEKEAYDHEREMRYLQIRKCWAFFSYYKRS